jgi:hypothetical protein
LRRGRALEGPKYGHARNEAPARKPRVARHV